MLMEKSTEQLRSIQFSSHTFVTAQTPGLLRLPQSSQTPRSHPVSMLMTALVSQVKVCALFARKTSDCLALLGLPRLCAFGPRAIGAKSKFEVMLLMKAAPTLCHV